MTTQMTSRRRPLGFLAGLFAAFYGFGVAGADERPDIGKTGEAGAERSAAALADFVDGRVGQWEIQPEDRRFDEIGWTTSLLEARRLAEQHGRPVFLFTHDGRMAIGRC